MLGSLATAGMMATTLVAAGAVYDSRHPTGQVNSAAATGRNRGPRPHPTPSLNKPINTVVVGETSPQVRYQISTNRVMVLHLSQDRKSAAFITFPVNTLVAIPGHRPGTIGSAYALGGAKLADRTLEQLFKTRMDHSAHTTYTGFLALSEQVGPVTVNNPKAFRNLGYTFPVGSTALSGAKSLAFVRSAPGDDADDEVSRQQLMVEAGVKKEFTGSLFDSKSNLAAFIKTGSKNVQVDEGLNSTALVKIAVSLNLKPSDIDVIRVPLAGKPRTLYGQQVQRVDPVLFKELATDLARDRVGDYAAAHPHP